MRDAPQGAANSCEPLHAKASARFGDGSRGRVLSDGADRRARGAERAHARVVLAFPRPALNAVGTAFERADRAEAGDDGAERDAGDEPDI